MAATGCYNGRCCSGRGVKLFRFMSKSIYTYRFIYTSSHICIRTCISSYTHIHIYLYTHICIHLFTYINIYIYIYISLSTYLYTSYMKTCIHIYIYTFVPTCSSMVPPGGQGGSADPQEGAHFELRKVSALLAATQCRPGPYSGSDGTRGNR